MSNGGGGRRSIRIGGGSAFFNDRLDAALELVEKGKIDVLMIETLAERTLALLHAAKRAGGTGYWDKLADRLKVLLPACAKHGTKLVTNGGGAAPDACAAMIAGRHHHRHGRGRHAVDHQRGDQRQHADDGRPGRQPQPGRRRPR